MADARKPDYQIYDDGSKVQDDVKSAVIAITVDERVDQASVCTVELLDESARMSDGKRFKVGSELRVELGYVGGTKVVFEGEITGWRGAFPRRGPQTLVVMALDRFHRMRRERKRRSFLKMKDSEIVQQIASDHGFSVEAKATKLAHDYVVQFNKSDADFLLERAALNGYEMFIDGRKMVFRAPSVDASPVATLKWHESLERFSPVISLGKAHASVVATAYNMKEKKPVSVTAKKGDELSLMGGTKTAADLATKLSSAPHQDPMQPMLSAEEADALAKGLLNRDAMRLVTGEGASQGNNLIRRGTVIEVDAIGDLLSGKYYVASALHTLLPGHGYTTSFRVRRTAIAKPPEPPAKKAPPAAAKQPTPDPAPGKVEFVVKNQFGEPVEGLEYVLSAPDGTQTTATIPANGVVAEQKAKGGSYTFAIKGVDPPVITWDDPPPAKQGSK